MRKLPDVPFTPEANDLVTRIKQNIKSRLADASRVPVSVLLWGPGLKSTSPLAKVRLSLRSELRRVGHAALFSEELCDPRSKSSTRLQQLAQAQEADVVVSIPCTPGAIGEIHDFVVDRRVRAHTLVFMNEEHSDGYCLQSLDAISNVVSFRLEYYPNELETGIIRDVTLQEVQKIRDMKYILAERY